jgi:cysteine synthase A
MPESMSVERRRIVAAYGAELVLTPREVGMKGSIAKAMELKAEIGNAWIPQQFENPSNPAVHEATTAQEILADFPEGLDYVITGVGTGGHLTGVSHVLKKAMPGVKTFAVESAKSALISGGTHSPHRIQGISAGFIPANLDQSSIDGAIAVTEEEAFEFAQRAAKEEGIFLGISSGASLAAVAKKIPEMKAGSRVLTFCYDTGERYLSIDGLFPGG